MGLIEHLISYAQARTLAAGFRLEGKVGARNEQSYKKSSTAWSCVGALATLASYIA